MPQNSVVVPFSLNLKKLENSVPNRQDKATISCSH